MDLVDLKISVSVGSGYMYGTTLKLPGRYIKEEFESIADNLTGSVAEMIHSAHVLHVRIEKEKAAKKLKDGVEGVPGVPKVG